MRSRRVVQSFAKLTIHFGNLQACLVLRQLIGPANTGLHLAATQAGCGLTSKLTAAVQLFANGLDTTQAFFAALALKGAQQLIHFCCLCQVGGALSFNGAKVLAAVLAHVAGL